MQNIESIISFNIKEHFPDCSVYKDRAEITTRPYFFIQQIQNKIEKKLGNLYQTEHFIQIIYLPESDQMTDYMKLNHVGTALYDIMEIMTYKEDTVKAKNMKYRIEDNTLQFFADITTHKQRVHEKTKMQILEIE